MTLLLRMNRKSNRIALIAGFGTLSGLVATACGTVRGGYESVPYQASRENGKFEVRDYPELSPSVYGYFDAPWTSACLRRNEVMLRTETAEPSAFEGKPQP